MWVQRLPTAIRVMGHRATQPVSGSTWDRRSANLLLMHATAGAGPSFRADRIMGQIPGLPIGGLLALIDHGAAHKAPLPQELSSA
jgi:hypothetical protein